MKILRRGILVRVLIEVAYLGGQVTMRCPNILMSHSIHPLALDDNFPLAHFIISLSSMLYVSYDSLVPWSYSC